MTKLISVAITDLRITFKDRSIWLQLVVIPLVIMFFIGLANGGFGGAGGLGTLRVDLFDNDNSPLSQQFQVDLRASNEAIVLCPMDNDADDRCGLGSEPLSEDRAADRVADGVTRATIIIPAGFSAAALAGEPAQIVYRSQDTLQQPGVVSGAVQAVMQRLNGAVVAARIGVAAADAVGGAFALSDEADRRDFEGEVYTNATSIWAGLPSTVSFTESAAARTGSPSGFSQSVPGIGTMYVMATVLVGSLIIIQERKQWTFQRILTMPVRPAQFIGGKMLARFITGMIQYGVAFAFGIALGVYFGSAPLALLLVMVTFTLCCTALALLMATFVKTEQQAGSVLNLVILVAAPLGGAWWPLELMPQWMQVIGHVSPVAWAMQGFRSVIFHGGGLPDVIVPMLVMLAMTAVIFLLAVRRFKYE